MPRARPSDDCPWLPAIAGNDLDHFAHVAGPVILLALGVVPLAKAHLDAIADPQEVALGAGADAQCVVARLRERWRSGQLAAGAVGPEKATEGVELADGVVGCHVDVHLIVDERPSHRDGVVDAVGVVPGPGDVVVEVRGAVEHRAAEPAVPAARARPVELVAAPEGPDPLVAVPRNARPAHDAQLHVRLHLCARRGPGPHLRDRHPRGPQLAADRDLQGLAGEEQGAREDCGEQAHHVGSASHLYERRWRMPTVSAEGSVEPAVAGSS
mmetsp:Transcript_40949/g.108507  ORF Transcript_40949/g.108507 Transcript_40949/m.108507 type:complete len:269 (-) Transcript_40949:9-815(-)